MNGDRRYLASKQVWVFPLGRRNVALKMIKHRRAMHCLGTLPSLLQITTKQGTNRSQLFEGGAQQPDGAWRINQGDQSFFVALPDHAQRPTIDCVEQHIRNVEVERLTDPEARFIEQGEQKPVAAFCGRDGG